MLFFYIRAGLLYRDCQYENDGKLGAGQVLNHSGWQRKTHESEVCVDPDPVSPVILWVLVLTAAKYTMWVRVSQKDEDSCGNTADWDDSDHWVDWLKSWSIYSQRCGFNIDSTKPSHFREWPQSDHWVKVQCWISYYLNILFSEFSFPS